MPPKRAKGKSAGEDARDSLPLARPPTPNDFKIVATVQALQALVDRETKWKNRIALASREEQQIRAKIARVQQLISLCERGIQQGDAVIDAIVDEQYNMVSVDPVVVQAWNNGSNAPPPSSLAPVKGPGSKSARQQASNSSAAGGASAGNAGGNNSNGGSGAGAAAGATGEKAPAFDVEKDPSLTHLPPIFWERRRDEKAALRTVLLALYTVPRLSKERRVPRPSTPAEMMQEVEEATRLATPLAELLAAKAPKSQGGTNAAGGKEGKGGGAAGGASPGKGSGKGSAAAPNSNRAGKSVTIDAQALLADDTGIADGDVVAALTNDLSSVDCLTLPAPRGLEPRVVHRVQMQRSRRLRLESSIAVFEAELPKLEARLRGVQDMQAVSTYGMTATAPEVAKTIDAELGLQKIRQVEDESFQAKRAPMPMAAGASRKGRGGATAHAD